MNGNRVGIGAHSHRAQLEEVSFVNHETALEIAQWQTAVKALEKTIARDLPTMSLNRL